MMIATSPTLDGSTRGGQGAPKATPPGSAPLTAAGLPRGRAQQDPQDEVRLQADPWPELAAQGRVTAPQDSTVAATMVPGPLSPMLEDQLCAVVDRLERKGFRFKERLSDGTFKQNLTDTTKRTWRFDAQLPTDNGFVVLMNLDELRTLDGVDGIGPQALSPRERAQVAALQALLDKGYESHDRQYHDRIHPASVLNNLRHGYPVYLYPNSGPNYNECKTPQDLLTLAYLEGVGNVADVARPQQAQEVQGALNRGLKLYDEYNRPMYAYGAYGVAQGPTSALRVGRDTVPVTVTAAQLDDLDALEAHLGEVDRAYDKFCKPLFTSQFVGGSGEYFLRAARPDDTIPVALRMAAVEAIVAKLNEAIPRQGTLEAPPLYDAIRAQASSPGAFVRMMDRALRRLAKTPARELLASVNSSPAFSRVADSDVAHTPRLGEVLEKAGSFDALRGCLDAMDRCRVGTLEERAETMLELLDAIPAGERDQVGDYFRNLEDAEGETLAEKRETYMRGLLGARLVQGSADEVWDAPEARPPVEPVGGVALHEDYVEVGGLTLPRRKQ